MSEIIKLAQTPLLEIAYEERGEAGGTPVILTHGFPDDVRTWDAVAPALAAPGLRILMPYQRGYGQTRFLKSKTPRTGQVTALGQDMIDFADALELERFYLVGHDWGARSAFVVAALAPKRLHAIVALAAGYEESDPLKHVAYSQAKAYWYQWHFATEHGRKTLAEERRDLCRWLWHTWSPGWKFDEETFARTAASWDNPDFVEITLHSYRQRWGEASADPYYEKQEATMQKTPKIEVATTLLIGADDGASLAESSAGKENLFAGKYERRVLQGVGHFIPREQPASVVKAMQAHAQAER